jgi:imidazoleglycerol-phosphate dehydratase
MGSEIDGQNLVARVTQKQQSLGYSDQRMAEIFGCSRQTYQQTRTGKKRVGNAYLNGATRFLTERVGGGRTALIPRRTGETDVRVELDIDGRGDHEVSTGIGMLDHLLSQLSRHGLFDINIKASGGDQHHVTEDVGICLGKAFGEALGEKRGIVRMADATVPMDDALATAAVDISGRGYAVLELPFTGNDMLGFPTDLVRHFLESFAIEGRLNLHARVICGSNDHHKAEALFKALGRALCAATRIDERIAGELPTTKGYLEG